MAATTVTRVGGIATDLSVLRLTRARTTVQAYLEKLPQCPALPEAAVAPTLHCRRPAPLTSL